MTGDSGFSRSASSSSVSTVSASANGSRPVYVGGAWHQAQVWSRLALPVGALIDGPAVLEQPDATIFVEPWLTARVDANGNILIERKEARP